MLAITISMTILIIILIFIFIQFSLSYKSAVSDPQYSSLESGFEMIKHSVMMSASFFMLAVLFVLFDLELVLLFTSVCFVLLNKTMVWFLLLIVLFFVGGTLFIEWLVSGLKWSS